MSLSTLGGVGVKRLNDPLFMVVRVVSVHAT